MTDPRQLHDDPNAAPVFWRLAPVAQLLGLDPRMLVAEAEAGRLPIRLERFGARGLLFCHSGDVVRYVQTLKRGTQ